MKRGPRALGAALMLGATASGVAAQRPGLPPADTAAAEPDRPSPSGALLRSLLVPGWGQAAFGAHVRGGVFFTLQTTSYFFLARTISKLEEARDIRDRRIAFVRDSLIEADVIPDTLPPPVFEDSLAARVSSHPLVQDIEALEDSREQQREDWIALALFWMLASGIDAYVNAHLADFPAQLSTAQRPDGRVAIGVVLYPGRRW